MALGLVAAFLAHVGVSSAAQGPVYDVSNTPALAAVLDTTPDVLSTRLEELGLRAHQFA